MHATSPGQGGLPRLHLATTDGASAEVYLHGAHVTGWTPAGGGPRLYLSPRAEYRTGAAIRGGVPVIFPQFAGFGPLPKHGFARSLPWTLAHVEDSGDQAVAHFTLAADVTTQRIWPHDFLAEFTVAVGGPHLALNLAVTNLGGAPFAFTTALHTYLAIDDLLTAAVTGLQGTRYADSAAGGVEQVDTLPAVVFGGEVDRIYYAAPEELRLATGGGRITTVRSTGFPDAVVWNPGAVKGAALADLEPDGYRRFVCIEAAVVGHPVTLAPGGRWQGAQTLLAA